MHFRKQSELLDAWTTKTHTLPIAEDVSLADCLPLTLSEIFWTFTFRQYITIPVYSLLTKWDIVFSISEYIL